MADFIEKPMGKKKIRINQKEALSIDLIGRLKFYLGLAIGLGSFISMALFLVLGKESARFATFKAGFLPMEDIDERTFYNVILILMAYNYALGLTLWYWLSRQRNLSHKNKLKNSIAALNSYMLPLVFLWVILRLLTMLRLVLHNLPDYEGDLSIMNNIFILFGLVPIVMFLQNWHHYKLVYKCKRWIYYSLITGLASTSILHLFVQKRQLRNDEVLQQIHKPERDYIKAEVEKAKENQVMIEADAVKYLLFRNHSRSRNQVRSVKRSFNNNSIVSEDTLVLQKIIIHNRKRAKWLSTSLDYVAPFQIADQVKMRKGKGQLTGHSYKLLSEILDELERWNDIKEKEEEGDLEVSNPFVIKPDLKAEIGEARSEIAKYK